MQEVIKSIVDMTKERLKSPFFGAFFISWIFINWRPILLIILSDQPIEGRIQSIDILYTNPKFYFFFPFLFAIIYLVLPGYIMQYIEKMNVPSIKNRKDIRNVIIKHDYDKKMDQADWENKLEVKKANYRPMQELNLKIELLTKQLEERDSIIENYKIELDRKIKNDVQAPSIFEKASNQIRMQNDFLIRELQNNNLIIDFLYFYKQIEDIKNIPLNAFDSLNNKKILDFALSKGIMQEVGEKDGVSAHYEITGIGNNIYNEIIKLNNSILSKP